MSQTIAVIGAGLIGRAWAIVFARAGHQVALYDPKPEALEAALDLIGRSVADLRDAGMVQADNGIVGRIQPEAALERAVESADHVQECGPEVLELKRALFATLDRHAPEQAVLASSSSGFPTSSFAAELPGRGRCLVAHPVNPPYLIPLVELSPAEWTDPQAVTRTRALMEAAGMAPILVRREIDGFILNRLQCALVNEAFRLAEDGYASPGDIDKTLRHGLGLRWSFMGPFETIDLNAPGGLKDYAERYSDLFYTLAKSQADPRRWSADLIRTLDRERRDVLPEEGLAERQTWRDRRLMALAAHKRQADREIGE
jgi:L-gulonate 3-dehydrogenase